MRKTQNFLRRAGSAALALTLTVSLCQPAFAATKAPFSKDETVYAVMAADGSVTKTTVSEHLYNADGLAGVEDKSTLKNIVNTESFAEYTRNGDTLVWNTDDTDVYYKGDTDRQLPISAKVTYTLDGRTAPLSELLGQSGHLVLSNVNAVNGLLESAAKSSVAAFVTLPGVKESLDGLLPEQVNGVAEYLQDSVTVEADVESLTAPQILLACAASAEALGQGDEVFDLDSLNDLTDGIAALNDAMNQLLDSGCKRVLYLYHSSNNSGQRKLAGCRDALAAHNLPVDETLMRRFDADKFSIHAVRDCLMELERDGLQFDAVLASEDVLSVGAMKYAQAVGRRVPENLSVVGYNNSNLCLCTEPELTSVDNRLPAICERIVETMLGVLEGREMPEKTVFTAEIIQRGSTRASQDK